MKPWAKDVFGYLFDPVSAEDFFAQYHERKALVSKHKDGNRYRDLLSIERIDELVSSINFQPGSLDMTRADPPVNREDYTFNSGAIDRGGVARQFQQGATLMLPQLHEVDATLADFCRAMESRLSCHVQTNIYLTPPHAQGFKTHYDDHDVFVLQVSGSKSWRLYDMPVDKPFRGEGFRSGDHEIGDPVEEFVLEAGDCAYVPRGLLHDALTHGDDASLHITVGLIVKTWADLMLEVISEVALRHPEFRQSLPVGFARPDFDMESVRPHFNSLVSTFAKEADLDEAFNIYVDNFIQSRLPATEGTIANFQTPTDPSKRYRLKANTPWRMAEDGEEIVIITSGGEIRFPAMAESGLHTLLDGGEISLETFSDMDEKDQQATIGRLFAFGLAEPV